jgi:hypothetical protein
MSGTIIPIMAKRTLDLSNTTANLTNEVVLVKAVDVSQWTEGELYVRVHGGSITGSATCQVIAKITSPTPEDPSSDFVYGTAMGTVTISSTETTAAPTLLRAALTANFGGMLQISFKAVQASSAQTIAPKISIELVMKA